MENLDDLGKPGTLVRLLGSHFWGIITLFWLVLPVTLISIVSTIIYFYAIWFPTR